MTGNIKAYHGIKSSSKAAQKTAPSNKTNSNNDTIIQQISTQSTTPEHIQTVDNCRTQKTEKQQKD